MLLSVTLVEAIVGKNLIKLGLFFFFVTKKLGLIYQRWSPLNNIICMLRYYQWRVVMYVSAFV